MNIFMVKKGKKKIMKNNTLKDKLNNLLRFSTHKFEFAGFGPEQKRAYQQSKKEFISSCFKLYSNKKLNVDLKNTEESKSNLYNNSIYKDLSDLIYEWQFTPESLQICKEVDDVRSEMDKEQKKKLFNEENQFSQKANQLFLKFVQHYFFDFVFTNRQCETNLEKIYECFYERFNYPFYRQNQRHLKENFIMTLKTNGIYSEMHQTLESSGILEEFKPSLKDQAKYIEALITFLPSSKLKKKINQYIDALITFLSSSGFEKKIDQLFKTFYNQHVLESILFNAPQLDFVRALPCRQASCAEPMGRAPKRIFFSNIQFKELFLEMEPILQNYLIEKRSDTEASLQKMIENKNFSQNEFRDFEKDLMNYLLETCGFKKRIQDLYASNVFFKNVSFHSPSVLSQYGEYEVMLSWDPWELFVKECVYIIHCELSENITDSEQIEYHETTQSIVEQLWCLDASYNMFSPACTKDSNISYAGDYTFNEEIYQFIDKAFESTLWYAYRTILDFVKNPKINNLLKICYGAQASTYDGIFHLMQDMILTLYETYYLKGFIVYQYNSVSNYITFCLLMTFQSFMAASKINLNRLLSLGSASEQLLQEMQNNPKPTVGYVCNKVPENLCLSEEIKYLMDCTWSCVDNVNDVLRQWDYYYVPVPPIYCDFQCKTSFASEKENFSYDFIKPDETFPQGICFEKNQIPNVILLNQVIHPWIFFEMNHLDFKELHPKFELEKKYPYSDWINQVMGTICVSHDNEWFLFFYDQWIAKDNWSEYAFHDVHPMVFKNDYIDWYPILHDLFPKIFDDLNGEQVTLIKISQLKKDKNMIHFHVSGWLFFINVTESDYYDFDFLNDTESPFCMNLENIKDLMPNGDSVEKFLNDSTFDINENLFTPPRNFFSTDEWNFWKTYSEDGYNIILNYPKLKIYPNFNNEKELLKSLHNILAYLNIWPEIDLLSLKISDIFFNMQDAPIDGISLLGVNWGVGIFGFDVLINYK